MSETPAVVFVPGAWHGGWCWDRVVDGLAARGIAATAVDLPGRSAGEPLGDLYGDADYVQTVLDAQAGPVTLVGHSYGGAVVTEVGHHPAVSRLVYIAAFALDVGESCGTAAANEPGVLDISHEGRPDLGAAFRPDGSGGIALDPAGALECFYNDCDPATASWALARLQLQPLAALQQPVTRAAWREKPSTYVVCARDLATHPDLERLLARRCTDSVEWDTGHSPFLSRPDLVVDLLSSPAPPSTG